MAYRGVRRGSERIAARFTMRRVRRPRPTCGARLGGCNKLRPSRREGYWRVNGSIPGVAATGETPVVPVSGAHGCALYLFDMGVNES